MPVTLACLSGLWRRDYLRVAHSSPDTTTWVAWLQGRRYYCDLRQPTSLKDLSAARCLAQLSLQDLHALACQQGFAGELTVVDSIAHWERLYDYQPPSGAADRATLQQEGDMLLETGTEQAYVEQWTRAAGPDGTTYGALLSDAAAGCEGMIVRCGQWLMYARARTAILPPTQTLHAALDAQPSLQAARALLDFEISFGTLSEERSWHIVRSTLPYKAGRTWRVELPAAGAAQVLISDVDDDGDSLVREWSVRDCD